MLYNQPYGISDPNAPYINGNPSTGTMGSIPPAEAIEHPQREIANFISKSGLITSRNDLLQLAKAVQSGQVNFGVDQGGPNDIQITPVVPVAAYKVGLRFVIRVGYGNTSAVTVNVNGLGKVPLIHTNLQPLMAYELIIGQLIEVAYDGANFQAISGVSGGAVVMTAPQRLFVDPVIGDDSLYDGTAAQPVGAQGGPFETIDKALTTMTKYNLGGWNFTIYLANGVYTKTTSIQAPLPNGSGTVLLMGNRGSPDQCQIFNTGQGSCFLMFNGGNYQLSGMSFRATAQVQYQDQGHGVWAMFGTRVTIQDCAYHDVPMHHLCVGGAAEIGLAGNDIVMGNAPGAHEMAYTNGVLLGGIGSPNDPALTVTKAVTMGAFANASDGGQIWSIWSSQTGAANVAGKKYDAQGNGVINSLYRGINALPGTIAGTTASGGQYR
jgi:hypothetical protein